MAKPTEDAEVETDAPETAAETEADLAEEHAAKAKTAAEKAEESAEAGRDVADDAEDLAAANVRFEGEPNGLPPAAPETQHQPADEVIALREWKFKHIDSIDSVHKRDPEHYGRIHRATEALCAMLQSKYPLAKND